jgi:ketosteroid isomerase-like protein
MRTTLFVIAAGLALDAGALLAQTKPASPADEIVAIVKAQWAAERQRNAVEAMKNVADDYTEFNEVAATRIDGKALALRLAEAGNKEASSNIADEMTNEKVQVYGDAAILTYNFFGYNQNKDGKVEPGRSKSTRVYVKLGGKWMLVHANFAPDPLPH